MDAIRAEHGLPPDPRLEMPSRHLVLSPFPPSLRDPACPLPATAHSFNALRPRRAPRAERPVAYFTLGTVFNVESGDLFERVLAGLARLDATVLVTVGSTIDPGELGPQPPHVRLAQYVPQEEVLPFCDVVVSHGGSGSVAGALAYGVPMVLLPMGADQPLNAARCAELGTAVVLDAVSATADDVVAAVTTVVTQPQYRHAAERLRDELAALPGAEHAVALLEGLR